MVSKVNSFAAAGQKVITYGQVMDDLNYIESAYERGTEERVAEVHRERRSSTGVSDRVVQRSRFV